MKEKNKTAIKYGVIAIAFSFAAATASSFIELMGLSMWFGAASIMSGFAGLTLVGISLADHFDN